jgi:uncharacterized membrane protein YeaQ/YmgE (transglycosylase-associated protein family)
MNLSFLDFVILLIVAGICGAVAKGIVGYSRGGCLTSIALGFIGALVGTWIARTLNLPEYIELMIGDKPFPIIWSIIGSALFVTLLAWLTRRPTIGYKRRWW